MNEIGLSGNSGKIKKEQSEYFKSDRFKWKDIKKQIPKELYPAENYKFIFETVIIILGVILVLQVPWSSVFSLNMDMEIVLGFPWHFFVFKPFEESFDKMPVLWGWLIIDILFYILIAYIINVLMNMFSKHASGLLFGKKDKSIPEEYKVKK